MIQETENILRVSVPSNSEVTETEWMLGEREICCGNAQVAGECFHIFFGFFQA